MRELELIDRMRRAGQTRGEAVRIGIGDDCAVLQVRPGEEIVVTTDFSLEGRHFRRDWHTAESAGWRCLARGLSDVAAMGARPIAAFLSLALPRAFDVAWVDEFLSGFRELGARYGVELAGGDTAEAVGENVIADVMVVGAVAQGRALLRSGAKVGDGVYVSGALGGSAAELARMAAGERGGRGPQSFPQPRVAFGIQLLGMATSCMDISDGIASDLAHLARASEVRMELHTVPIAEGATEEQALFGGEDYELLFTAPEAVAGAIRVGTVVPGSGVSLRGAELRAGGWQHFE